MRHVLMYSGGLDSFLLLDHLQLERNLFPELVFVDYGQTNQEIECAVRTRQGLRLIDARPVLQHVWSPTPEKSEMPLRNIVLYSIVAAVLHLTKEDVLYCGINAGETGEHYADCSAEAIQSMSEALLHCGGPSLIAPLYDRWLYGLIDKYHAFHKRTFPPLQPCNFGQGINCGECPKCQKLKRAFKASYPEGWEQICRRHK